MNRIKRKQVGTYLLTATAENEEGVAEVISAPATVEIRDGAGTLVVEDTPTITLTGHLTYAADAALLPNLDTYTVLWTGVVDGESQSWETVFELVGGYLFEIADLRAKDRAFTDANKYPTAWMRDRRTEVEDMLEGEDAGSVAFVPRGRRVTVSGNDGTDLILPDLEVRELYAVTIDGVALTEGELDDIKIDDNRLIRDRWPVGVNNITVHYAHGYDRCPPGMTRAALILARDWVVSSPIPGRATAQTMGDQMFRLTIAGRDGLTGLPEVDVAIKKYGRKKYGFR